MLIHLVFLSLYFGCLLSQGIIPPESISYRVVDSSLLGATVKLGVMEVTTSEDLYHYTPFFCLPSTKPPIDPNDCETFCDYSGKTAATCGILREIDGVRPASHCVCQRSLCSEIDDWEQLEWNTQSSVVQLDASSILRLRFFFPLTTVGFTIRITMNYGSISTGLSSTDPTVNPNNGSSTEVFAFANTVLCPGDFRHRAGTWFMSFAVRGQRTSSFSYVVNDLAPNYSRDRTRVRAKEYPCAGYPSSYYCPPLNVQTGVEIGALSYVPMLFKFTKCARVMFYLEISSPIQDFQPLYFSIYQPENVVPLAVNSYFRFTPQIFTICPFGGSQFITFQVAIGGSRIPFNATLYASDIQTEWGEVKTPVSELHHYSGENWLIGTMKLVCGDTYFNCDPGSSETGGSCNELWIVMPSEDRNPFWPIPRMFYQTDFHRFDSVALNDNQTLVGNRLSVAIMMTGIIGNLVRINLQDAQLSNCQLYFPPFSSVGTNSGEILSGLHSIEGKRKLEACDYQKFRTLSQRIDELSSQLDSSTSLSQSLTTIFEIDVIAFSEDWTGCQSFLDYLTSETIQSRIYESTKLCTLQMTTNETLIRNDPCCNWNLGWEQCCTNRDVETMVPKKSVNVHQVQTNCSIPDCVQSLMEEYIFYADLINGEHGCSNIIQEDLESIQKRELAYFQDCKAQVFGTSPDGMGKPCHYDSDCISKNCDRELGVCISDFGAQRNQTLDTFFDCVVTNMSATLRGSVMQFYKITNQSQLADKLSDEFMNDGCLGPSGRSLADPHFHLFGFWGNGACGECNWECFDFGCPREIECEGNFRFGRTRSLCYAAIIPINADYNPGCFADYVCNWNHSITTQSECEAPSQEFCGYCFTQFNCHEFEHSQSECSQQGVCVTGDGQLDTTLSEGDCPIKGGACSFDCPAGVECTPEQCQKAGKCSDQQVADHIRELSLNQTFVNQGFCLGPISVWNQPDCAFDSEHSNNFPWASHCVWPTLSKTACQQRGFIWRPIATGQADCESVILSCSEPKTIPTALRTMKDQTECELCGGEFLPLFQWTPAEWIYGEYRSLEWVNRKLMPQSHSGPVVDLKGLWDFLFERSVQSFLTALRTDISCRLVPTKYLIERAVCSCEGNCGDLSSQDLVVGTADICPGTQQTLVVPPSVLIFSPDSTQLDDCVRISVDSILYKNIRASESPPLDSTFRKSNQIAEGVVNAHGVQVGQLLQNGVALTFAQDLQNVEFCFSVDASVLKNTQYSTLDMGYRVSTSRVEPMNLNATFDSGQYCFVGVQLRSDMTNQFFIISRQKDWESQQPAPVYNTGDIAILVVMFILYLLPLSLLVLYETKEMGITWESGRLMNLFFIAATGVRAAYFLALLISQPSGTETWWEFVGIELPILFYLSALSVSAMLWSNVTTLHNEKNRTPYYVFVGNLVLYLFFIAVAIANSLVQAEGTYSCYGRVYNSADRTTSDAIKISYRAVLSFAALLVAIVLSYWGSTVLLTLFGIKSEGSDDPENVARWRKKLAKKWFMVILVCCLSIFFQCGFFIGYTLSGESAAIYSLFLIPAEIIPELFMFCVLHWNFLLSTSSAMSPTGQMTSV